MIAESESKEKGKDKIKGGEAERRGYGGQKNGGYDTRGQHKRIERKAKERG